ncbi:MAG: hypothetical protein OEV59_00795 [Deltaproteobacteria bacterium]|nr:hypothetical protein [Deltaproteobacteria bacterium]
MKKRVLIFFAAILLTLCTSKISWCYDDEKTHPEMTKKAVQGSQLDSYLKDNFDNIFSLGFDSVVFNKSVIDWLRDGSTAEDSPLCRASNHFHNPPGA